ncbi:hypothetical protein [Streptomyces sp. AMCC400023]|uniref:hypothetical protein n=1 Tax=Streptomyces sp. AMCC400023 TaxID=2056258 RepID=UPI001F29AF6B|nr:hypothetical protein [Streptomyces sp. AMCC400023]UJV42064.1 hypothetical protein CVT30_21420 [Streptomyces sp. AMCC400023]
MMLMRIWLYGMVIPGALGIAALAAVVETVDGEDLTLTRLLAGCGAMIAVQIIGGFVGGRAAARRQPTA